MADLTDSQMDALREMGSIGAGNAATALSQLITDSVEMIVPAVKVLPLEAVPEFLGGADKIVYVVFLQVIRELEGTMLTIFAPESAEFLVDKLLDNKELDMHSEIASSALKEVGSIICGSYLSALSQLVGINSIATVPAIACDMLGAMLDAILAEIGQVADEVFMIDVELLISNTKLECSQLFLPKPEALKIVLSSLGV
ncbi:MAG: chemotaxis protein CheC [Candidatus Omnitrophota bacterium]